MTVFLIKKKHYNSSCVLSLRYELDISISNLCELDMTNVIAV